MLAIDIQARLEHWIKQPFQRPRTTVGCSPMMTSMDLTAVRTFVAIVDAGQFQEAATNLSITPQAVSKRIAVLEKDLGVQLFSRTARGARLTIDGQALLPYARLLLQAEDRAAASVRPGRRALRVDVIGRRLSLAGLLRDFHRVYPETELDVVTLFDSDTAISAVRSGTIDATFRAVDLPGRRLPDGIEATPVFDEPLHLFTGPTHEFADARAITPAQLAGRRIWMPGNEPGTEWAAYYDELAATFGLTIESTGPNFGIEPLLDTIAGSSTLATFVSEQTPLVWPTDHDLRRIPLRDPTPVYPHSLVWRTGNPHPALTVLRDHLTSAYSGRPASGTWAPKWASTPHCRARPERCRAHFVSSFPVRTVGVACVACVGRVRGCVGGGGSKRPVRMPRKLQPPDVPRHGSTPWFGPPSVRVESAPPISADLVAAPDTGRTARRVLTHSCHKSSRTQPNRRIPFSCRAADNS